MTVLPVAVTVSGYIAGSVLILLIAGAAYLVRRYWPWRTPSALPEPRPEIDEPPADRHVRTPSDVLHLTIGVLLVLLGLLFADRRVQHARRLRTRPDQRLRHAARGVAHVINLLFQGIASLLFAAITIVALWRRRYRLFVMLIATSLFAQLLLKALDQGIVQQFGEPELLRAVQRPDWVSGQPEIDSYWVASSVAVVVLGSPWVSRAWRRAGWITVIIAVIFRTVAGGDAPTDVVVALGAGAVSGSAVLLAFGAPSKRPRGPAVVEAMARADVPLVRLTRAGVDARSSTPYFANAEDGRQLFIKVLGRDERSADLMFRLYRFLRVKDVGDRGPFTSLQRMVEHEALVALYSSDKGILTPRLVVTTNVGDDGFLLAYERTAGDSLDRVDDEAITDDVLLSIWQSVEQMRRRRVAHRDLRLANVLLAPDGQPWLIDFGFAEIAATDQMLDTDVAELLSSTALKVGVERAVDAAIAVIGKAAVASAAPRIQPLALSTATRKSLQARKPLCDELRKYAGEASGAGDVEPQDLQRIKPRTVLVFISLAVAFYLLIPQLADVSGVWSKLKQADWTWALYALGASALTYLGATLTVTGAVPVRIPFFSTLGTQLAGSFVNRIIPAHVGGIATNVRYLQKQGIELAVASSSVGLQQTLRPAHARQPDLPLPAVGRAQRCGRLRLPAVGTDGADRTHGDPGTLRTPVPAPGGTRRAAQARRPDPEALGSRGGGRGAPAVQGRRAVRRVRVPDSLVYRRPSLLRARLRRHRRQRGQHRRRVPRRLRYRLGRADTRGIGAVEAALIAGLTAIGVDREVAVPSVFLYRIATFWLPIVPGWIAFVLLQRRGDL